MNNNERDNNEMNNDKVNNKQQDSAKTAEDKLKDIKEQIQNGTAREEKLLDADFKHILEEEEKLKEKLKQSSHLERFTTDIVLFISLVKDYSQGNYRDIPYKTISAVVIGLLYILNPIDIIPDFIPVIGYIDDALVVAFCLKMVEKDLHKYQAWKQTQKKNSETATDDLKADESKTDS
jgi:uncharacterized membrane protein YkvA (DUF1232 family)